MPNTYQLVYLSRLGDEVSPACLATIVRTARQRNLDGQINSLLIFDGLRICQILEGEQAAVCDLAERIRADERHTGFRVLHQAESPAQGLFGHSSLDYALSYDHSLVALDGMCGSDALAQLVQLLPRLDRAPAEPAL
ncbi:BLUF domain-containing protein [Thiobacillus sp.]